MNEPSRIEFESVKTLDDVVARRDPHMTNAWRQLLLSQIANDFRNTLLAEERFTLVGTIQASPSSDPRI